MNITVFEFLKRLDLDRDEYFVYICRNGKGTIIKTLKEIKAQIGIEPFNPLADGGQEEVKDFRISAGSIQLFID